MDSQTYEAAWWGDCTNTYGEETKQAVYARLMALELVDRGGPGPTIDLVGRGVVDIGGGPSSLLLKTTNGRERAVVDPCPYPEWVTDRYEAAGIKLYKRRGEDWKDGFYDEAWIYNVLQHVDDPELVVANARAVALRLRIFEWVDVPVHEGHPHELTADELGHWCGGKGHTRRLNEQGCVGMAFFGVFG